MTDILNDHLTKLKGGRKNHGIPKGFYTVTDALKSTGYRSDVFDKWHVGYEDGSRPYSRVLMSLSVTWEGCIHFFTQIHPRSKYVDCWSGDE